MKLTIIETEILASLRAKRKAEAADMAPGLGLSFASRLRTLGLDKEANEVEIIVKRIHEIALSI
jgi:hypothetical protein